MLTKTQRDFLLIPKALPSSTHFVNLRAMLPKSEWDRMRKKVYAAASHRCELCNASNQLEAHEVWYFDFEKQTQFLETLVALCATCHRLQHVLLMTLQISQGILNPYALSHVVKKYNTLTTSDLTENQLVAKATEINKQLEVIEWDVVIARSFDELFK